MNRIVLGRLYLDSITGFTGMAVARTEYFPPAPDRVCLDVKQDAPGNRRVVSEWFDSSRLVALPPAEQPVGAPTE